MTTKTLPLSLETSWTYKATVLADLISRHVSTILQNESELNLSQWRVMVALADRPGRTASEVVAITPMDKGIVSRAVSTLVQRGSVERSSSQEDGRRSHLKLTPSGEALYCKIVDALDASGVSGRTSLSPATQANLNAQLDEAIALYTQNSSISE